MRSIILLLKVYPVEAYCSLHNFIEVLTGSKYEVAHS